jgi:hypothetical protein
MDWSVVSVVIATVMGPILAVQAQKYLERHRDQKRAKGNIFRVLMATRATRLAGDHVQALNGIELAFYGGGDREKKVLEAWKAYHDHLNTTFSTDRGAEWEIRQVDLFIDLLHEMAVCLGYDFDKTQIKNSWYSPKAHGVIEDELQTIRRGFAEILTGKASFAVTAIAATKEEANEWAEARKLLIEVLKAHKSIPPTTPSGLPEGQRELGEAPPQLPALRS